MISIASVVSEAPLEHRQRRRRELSAHVRDGPAVDRPARDRFGTVGQQPTLVGKSALAVAERHHAEIGRGSRVARGLLETLRRAIAIAELLPRRRR
jgi:hypothetical protein